jgi:aspartyl-tRNA(Asn)/glutamyl-tRNA(Gln) amidotransferase subunit A
LTPHQHIRALLDRIEAANPQLNAFLNVDAEGALAAAEASGRRWRAAAPRSALDGMGFGIKANIAVAGWPWHGGILAYAGRAADHDAAIVARLRALGGVPLGLLNMDEGALGARGDNLAFGRCVNPRAPGRSAGGSSSGAAAATASGLCDAALGTDTMGSVRIPAAFCGVAGHLPLKGALSSDGVMPLSFTLDAVGVLARRPEEAAAVMRGLTSGRRGAHAPGAGQGRCAVLHAIGGVAPDAAVLGALDACAAEAVRIGLKLEPLDLPSDAARGLSRACLFIVEAEAALEHEAALQRNPEGFGGAFQGMLAWAARQPALRLAEAYRTLERARRALREALAPFDFVLSPTTPFPAWPLDGAEPRGVGDFTLLANAAGLAATAFPVFASGAGPPLSAQLMGWSDQGTLRTAARLARGAEVRSDGSPLAGPRPTVSI